MTATPSSKSPSPGLKRKQSDLEYDEFESDSESASSASSNHSSDYTPQDASDPSDDSEDISPPPSPLPKRAKKSHWDPSEQNSRGPKVVRKTKHPKKAMESDPSASVPNSESLTLSQSEGGYSIPRGERNALVDNLSRERAKRMLEAIELPNADELSPDERRTAHQLLTRGCMPAIPRHWEKDFSTLPGSLFFSIGDESIQHSETDFVLEPDKGTEFSAIRAFQEILKISGIVRDHCNVLDDSPEISIKKSIEKYLRWALNDAHIRVQPTTTPVYTIYNKKEREGAKEAFSNSFKILENLVTTWRSQIPSSPNPPAWPSVLGFVICGPLLSVVSLDCDPTPQTKTQGMRLLGQFDLSDLNNDVWNTLAIAIAVMHVKRTMVKLATKYTLPFVAPIVEDEREVIHDIDL